MNRHPLSNIENSPPSTKRRRTCNTATKQEPSIYDDFLDSQVGSQEWTERLHQSRGASMYIGQDRSELKSPATGDFKAPKQEAGAIVMPKREPSEADQRARASEVEVRAKRQRSDNPLRSGMRLMSIEEHKIMWLESDLTKAQNQYALLTDRHTKLVDTTAMQTTKMEREVMELKAENKALVQAGSVAGKDWKKRVGILEAALSEKKKAYSRLSSQLRQTERERDNARKELKRYKARIQSLLNGGALLSD